MVEEAKVGLDDGAHYGASGNGFMRLNFGCRRQLLVKAMQQIEEAVNALQK
ncbi:hypothetical protein D3C75_1389070 [compost metagenome]